MFNSFFKGILLILAILLAFAFYTNKCSAWDKKKAIGGPTLETGSLLDVQSTTLGSIYAPKMTTTQRNALTTTEGLGVWDLTENKRSDYNGSSWVYQVYEDVAAILTNKTFDADLNTLSNIEDENIKAGAEIARSKIGSGTADHVIINDGTGHLSSEAQLANTRGGLGADSAAWSGVLKVSTGTFSASAVDLTTDVTGILPLANGGTGSTTKNFVDLTTNQSIAGVKTFTGKIKATGTGNGNEPCQPMAQTERDAIPTVEPECIYNTTANQYEYYDGSSWVPMGEGGLGGGLNYLPDGSFEDGVSLVTVNTGAAASSDTAIYMHGEKSLLFSTAGAGSGLDYEECINNQAWVGQTLEVSCFVKSGLTDLQLCSSNDVIDPLCVDYDGSDIFKKVSTSMVMGAGSGSGSTCWRLTKTGVGSGSGNLDACSVAPLEPNVVTGVDEQSDRINSFSGFGSTATMVPYFSNLQDTSGGGLYTLDYNDSTNGMTITALEDNVVIDASITGFSTAATKIGWSLNSTELTTNIEAITTADRLGYSDTAAGVGANAKSVEVKLMKGDVLRPHTSGVGTTAARWAVNLSARRLLPETQALTGEAYEPAAGYWGNSSICEPNIGVSGEGTYQKVIDSDCTFTSIYGDWTALATGTSIGAYKFFKPGAAKVCFDFSYEGKLITNSGHIFQDFLAIACAGSSSCATETYKGMPKEITTELLTSTYAQKTEGKDVGVCINTYIPVAGLYTFELKEKTRAVSGTPFTNRIKVVSDGVTDKAISIETKQLTGELFASLNPIFYKKHYVGANYTGSQAPIPNTSYNNLKVGTLYEVNLKCEHDYTATTNQDRFAFVSAVHNSTEICSCGVRAANVIQLESRVGSRCTFIAEASTLVFNLTMTSETRFLGDGTNSASYFELRELPANYIETNKWE